MMVFIIGGRGFVGSAFARYCAENGISHQVIHRQNYHEFVGVSCDILINANGNSKKFLAETSPQEDFELSVSSVEKTFKDIRFGVYVFCSSIDVYNDLANPANNAETAIIDPSRLSFYGFHKYLAEHIVRKYAPNWCIARFGGFVGQGLKKNSIFDLLNQHRLWVDVKSRYQYVSTDSAAKIVFALLKAAKTNKVFNICGMGTISLQQIIEYLPTRFSIRYAKDNPPVEHYEINIDKLAGIFEVPRTEETVRNFVESYVAHLADVH